MSETLSVVISIFGLIGLGYLAARTRLISAAVGDALSIFVFTIAIPLLLFEILATADFHGVAPWRIWTAYFLPFAIVWALAHVMVRRIFGRDGRAGIVAGGSAAYSNAVLIGIPLIQAALGEEGAVFLIVIVAVHLPIMMAVSVALNEWATVTGDAADGTRRDLLRRLAVSLSTHPILIGIAVGLLWRAAGFAIPSVASKVIDPLAAAAGPLALFASGTALVNYGIARQIPPAIAISGLKLVLMPALVFAAARTVGLPPIGVATLTLTAACPTGVNVFLIASRLGTGQALASNTLLISTAAGAVTVTLLLAALKGTLG